MGRKKQYPTRITLPLPDGLVERIDAAREPGEVRLDVIRAAIEKELRRREKAAPKPDA